MRVSLLTKAFYKFTKIGLTKIVWLVNGINIV